MPILKYLRVDEIDPARDAAAVVADFVNDRIASLGCLMPAIGEALERAKLDVTRTQLYDDVRYLAEVARSRPPDGGKNVVPAMNRVLEAHGGKTPTDAEGVPTTRAGFLLRCAAVRLALATDTPVSAADIGTIACLSPSRVRQIALGTTGHAGARPLERDPGGRHHFTAASARMFLSQRGVPGF